MLGAAYLVILGIQAMRSPRLAREDKGTELAPQLGEAPSAFRGAFLAGYLSDVFNPKTGLFYVAIVPQVIPHAVSVFWGTLAFCAVDACVTTGWFAVVACIAQRLSGWLHRPRVLAATERSTGVVLVGIGLRTAVERT